MAKTKRERDDDEREARLGHIRSQLAAGELVVRQMTDSERARWELHSAASDRHATPEERARRDRALKARNRNKRGA